MAEKPSKKKAKSSDTRKQAAAEEASQAVQDTKNRARITSSQVENVSTSLVISPGEIED